MDTCGAFSWRLATTNLGGRHRVARRPNQAVFCSRIRKHCKTFPSGSVLRCSLERQRLEALSDSPASATRGELLQFDLGAGVFQLLLGSFGVGLVHAFLDGLRSAVDEVLGFLQAQARDFTDRLMTPTFCAPASSSCTVNSVFSSTAAAAGPAPAPAGAA